MRPSVSAVVAVLFSLVAGLSILGAVSQQGDPLPIIFSGPVFIQGQPAPVGLSVVACVLECGTGWESEAMVTRAGGEPEEPVWYTGIVVQPGELLLGELITFWIVTDFGRIRATQSSVYQPDFNNLTPILRLEFEDPVPLSPTPTTPPTPTTTPTPTVVPTPSATAISPIPGDASVPGLSRLVLIVGAAALLVGGAILFVIRRRKAV